MAVIVAATRYKLYPEIAKVKGWQGKVEVRMVIGANGMLTTASTKTSSGYEVLDNQALVTLRNARNRVPIPVNLRGRSFSIDCWVIFDLEDR